MSNIATADTAFEQSPTPHPHLVHDFLSAFGIHSVDDPEQVLEVQVIHSPFKKPSMKLIAAVDP